RGRPARDEGEHAFLEDVRARPAAAIDVETDTFAGPTFRNAGAGEEQPTCATPGTVPLSDSADTAVMGDAKTPAVPTDARVASAMAYPAPHSLAVVEVLRHGRPDSLIPETSIVPSHAARWDGLALESFPDLPPVAIPDHEHPTHFLGLLLGAAVETEWTTAGRTQRAVTPPGTIYLLPKGTRDRLAWRGRSNRILVTLEPRLVTGALEQTAHLDDLELQTHWQLEDRHLLSLILALRADLEDGCPAGALFGEWLGTAMAVYLARRYGAIRAQPPP